MFNKSDINQRIGDMPKSETLEIIKPCEKKFIKLAKQYKVVTEYDVTARELPWFKTLAYTEYAHCFKIEPLNHELRKQQFTDAYSDKCEVKHDYINWFRSRIEDNVSNKYSHIKDTLIEPRDHLIVPVGSNKLKKTVCLNKLIYIRDTYGEDEVYLKPHPLTTHELVGELRDILGEDMVLDRNANMYQLMQGCEVVHTSHRSESAVYAVALGKELDCIDVYNHIQDASFYAINRHLFIEPDPVNWVNTTFNSFKSGIFNPEIDEKWEEKMEDYFEYILDEREKYRTMFVYNKKGTMK